MEERRTRPGLARVRQPVLALLLLIGALCAGCGPADSPQDEARDIQRMLDRRAAAVLRHDADGFLAVVDRSATGYRAEQRRVIGNLSGVPLRSWRYRLLDTGRFVPAAGDGKRVAADVRLAFRLGEHRPAAHRQGRAEAPLTVVQRLTLTERAGRWYVAAEDRSETGGRRSVQQLWDQGPITAVSGRRSLVLGVGRDPGALRVMARRADRAVDEISEVWPRGWDRHVVVLVPRTQEEMAALLGRPAPAVRDIAAVTTGEAGRVGADRSGQVVVNPEAYASLGDFGRQVVLTHETAHVATRPSTSSATPMWLSEGFADWAGYRTARRPAERIAPGLARRIAAGQAIGGLPGDEEFGFDGDSGSRASAYERGWLACRMIADHWGERRLTGFYRAMGSATTGRGAADHVLRSELGLSRAEFTARWRRFAAHELG
ncbi:hypothetical protein [Streptomyces meridianus]|uniref:Lipoprotein n=1 Tax=Streptomyces meridianus TaxID=2938945 RepID=A0ABT0X3A9_9ACTN|nr:hypothetical protein [Streptomyces meridianus]MCM2576408.1 hypothetical protein [Streptomyces meridianus]